jgi:two-component system, NtrC family, sensor histidine kinase KinB
MKIKAKLTSGIGTLLLLIIVLAVLSGAYVLKLKEETNNILSANYNSLDYARRMLLSLDDSNDVTAGGRFMEDLALQQGNVTETGESEITRRLTDHVRQLSRPGDKETVKQLIRRDLLGVMQVNMNAIQRKSRLANATVDNAILWIITTGTICFLIAFVLLARMPGSISRPVRELTESIRQIAARNYKLRLGTGSRDEFGDLARSFNTMAEKLDEYDNTQLAQVMYEKKRIETLINNMNDPVIGLDEEGTIAFVNGKAAAILNTTESALIGKNAQNLALDVDLIRLLIRDVPGIANPGTKPSDPFIHIFAEGREQYFEKELIGISMTPTGESERRPIGNVIILRNVTSFKELEFAKTNFMATISHELKTPISSIKLSLQLLEKEATGTVNSEQQQLIGSIREDSDRLLKITGELLNLSQIETGNIQLVKKSSDPYELIGEAMNAVSKEAEHYGVFISKETEDDLPHIALDNDKTQWVLSNLLVNAIHYSAEGQTVGLRLLRSGHALRFEVTDKGPGIGEQFVSRIFDRYFQVPGISKPGSGLGLAICREFIEAQGGRIGVDSRPGEGSTFYFELEL